MASIHMRAASAVFLHLPKTAGHSISTALADAFPRADRLPVRGMRRAHGAARYLSRRIGEAPLMTGFSFCFIRNPWDWAVSGWKHVTENANAYGVDAPDCAAFITGGWRDGLKRNPNKQKFANARLFVAYHTQITQWEHLCLGWPRVRLAPIAFYARFERLDRDWERICERLGSDIVLPKLNVSAKSHYTDVYDDRLRRVVAERNAPLIERFGYRFGA